jgi:hypothetical protein
VIALASPSGIFGDAFFHNLKVLRLSVGKIVPMNEAVKLALLVSGLHEVLPLLLCVERVEIILRW